MKPISTQEGLESWQDEVMREMRANREAHAEECGNDVRAISRRAHARALARGWEVTQREQKRASAREAA
jgi:hypothetical protein